MIAIVFVVFLAFLVLGPKNLAVFAGKAGSLYARLQSAKAELLADLGSPLETTQAAARTELRPLVESPAIDQDEESTGIAAAIEQLCEGEDEWVAPDPPSPKETTA